MQQTMDYLVFQFQEPGPSAVILPSIKIHMMRTKYLSLMCVSVVRVSSWPGGAPDDACSSMLPAGHGAEPQTGSSPYIVKVHKFHLDKNDVIGE